MTPVCQQWLGKLANLHKDRSRGDAPHKPLLLLVVIDLFESGKIPSGKFHRDGDLAFRFNSYWALGARGRGSRPDVMLPFFHTRTDGFWTPLEADGRIAEARNIARTARVDPEFLACLSSASFREAARKQIVRCHFEGEDRRGLCELMGLPLTPEQQEEPVDSRDSKSETKHTRDVKFAFRVLPTYDFRCALTRYRMVAVNGTTALDAAHVKSFSSGGPNTINNGIALSKTAHWLFDRGFWSLDDDFRILVKLDAFQEQGEDALLLKRRKGETIHLPGLETARPSRAFLDWHRSKHKF